MHDHLSIEWLNAAVIAKRPEPDLDNLLEEICLLGLRWALHRDQPVLRIEDRNGTWARYIPFTSMSEFHVGDAPKSCDNEKEDEPEFIGNSKLMEPGSGIYLDADGKVDEDSPGASS